MFAPKWEKTLAKQIKAGKYEPGELHAIQKEGGPQSKTASLLEAMAVAMPASDHARARALLDWLVNLSYRPEDDAFFKRYMPAGGMQIAVAPGIVATLPLDNHALRLMLAELEQEAGNIDRAIQVVEETDPTTIAAVSLAELYASQGEWTKVIELTDGMRNDDDAAVYLLTQRGVAFREQRLFESSRESLKEALRSRTRSPELRQVAAIERGKTYLAEGKKGMAKKDFERVMAENSSIEGLSDLIAACG